MQIETQFAVGQLVHRIGRATEDPVVLPCKFCRGSARVRASAASGDNYVNVQCPICEGRARLAIAWRTLFAYAGEATIGKVAVELADPSVPGFNGRCDDSVIDPAGLLRVERYMLDVSGFPSGTLYTNVELYGSREEADVAVEARNDEIVSGGGWKPLPHEYAACVSFLEHADLYEHTPEHLEAARLVVAAFEFEPAEEDRMSHGS